MEKVRDRDHLSGNFEGVAHTYCNLIFVQNLSGYDAHIFIKEFGNDSRSKHLISNNEEKYIFFSKVLNCTHRYLQWRFLDSLKDSNQIN